jgi:hypothetical protein
MFQTGIGIIIILLCLESFPVYRYRNNIQVSLNINNNYNYVNYRRSNQAVVFTTQDVQMGMKDNIQIIIFREETLMFQIVMN